LRRLCRQRANGKVRISRARQSRRGTHQRIESCRPRVVASVGVLPPPSDAATWTVDSADYAARTVRFLPRVFMRERLLRMIAVIIATSS
jgi:hypothetical protein